MNTGAIRIEKKEGFVEIRPIAAHANDARGTPEQGNERPAGSVEVVLLPHQPGVYIPRRCCQSTLPLDLLQYWAERSDFAWFCNSVARHEDQTTVPGVLKRQLFAYFPADHFEGKRLLDFGCGTGASTFALARLLPRTEVIGVELDSDRVDIANKIKSCLGLSNVQFQCSPAGDQLPPGTSDFDFVMLSAVYEHLLPAERKTIMPMLWSALKTRGVIFINQTPYRYSPIEDHSSGLWFINYMPDAVAHWSVRKFAGRNPNINQSTDWKVHLRGGLRGGTEASVISDLTRGNPKSAQVLQPNQNGLRDRADFWLARTNPGRYRTLKQGIASLFRFTDRIWGTMPSINLEVAVQKRKIGDGLNAIADSA